MEIFQKAIAERARREVVVGIALLTITMGAFVLFFAMNYFHTRGILEQYLPVSRQERLFYNLIFLVFMYGSFTYQVSRLAFFWHVRSRIDAGRADLERFEDKGSAAAPSLEILVPSYKEEPHVIWQTLMSAALVDYPGRSIVLLLDNPPEPDNAADRELLLQSRQQIDLVTARLAPIAAQFADAALGFRKDSVGRVDRTRRTAQVGSLYAAAADFLEGLARDVEQGRYGGADDHTRRFFVERILLEPAQAHRRRAEECRARVFTQEELVREFERLDAMFTARLSYFERKQYWNLSHAATKAANLNAYIGVMGRRFNVEMNGDHRVLVESPYGSVKFADAQYLVILDADSFLLPDYAKCMISSLESERNARVAVMQTPYTTIPDTPNLIERAAAATTDIYYYVTEGMSFANAGSWIGAAAAIRKEALMDIVVHHEERGVQIPIFIQDKTVIEDTGATIDLALKNWSVQNYPARLSYSATPPDFGALVIQRRRWSNGGLIILPSVLRYLLKSRKHPRHLLEGLLRIHYMVMPACISISMLAMLLYPFDFKYVSSWIYITLPPYIYLVCRDLVSAGYRRSDFFKAYTLFLILLPVVLVGVLNSIVQIVLRSKTEFGRTPKVEHRTAAPAMIHLAIIGLFIWSLLTARDDVLSQNNQLHAVFALSNALALGYGIFVLIGLRSTLEDLVLPLRRAAAWLVRPRSKDSAPSPAVGLPATEPSTTPGGGWNLLPVSVRSAGAVAPHVRPTAEVHQLQHRIRTVWRGRNSV